MMTEPSTDRNDSRISLPGWMTQEVDNTNRGEFQFKHRRNFLGKSILQMKRVLAEELLTEYYASRDGLLQRMDARVKLIMALVLIILTGFSRSIYVLMGLWVFTILLILLSRLPLFTLQKRIWGFIPLLTLLVSAPATLNIITDGTPWLMIHEAYHPLTWMGINIPAEVYVSKQGFTAALFLFMRVGLSLSMGALLTMTTPIAKLLKSLQVMGVPSLFITIIEMSYRYLVLLLNLSIEMFEARSLRTVGELSMDFRRAQVGSSIAALFARSMDLADEIYLAMTARGYTGQAVSIDGWKQENRPLAAENKRTGRGDS